MKNDERNEQTRTRVLTKHPGKMPKVSYVNTTLTGGTFAYCHVKDLGNGLGIIYHTVPGADNVRIHRRMYQGTIAICGLQDGVPCDLPILPKDVVNILPEIFCGRRPDFNFERHVKRPEGLTSKQNKAWDELRKKRPDQYDVLDSIVLEKDASIRMLRTRFGLSFEEMQDATDAALAKYGTL